jgi:hypothetical protein
MAYWWQFQLGLRDHRRIVGQRRHQEMWDQLIESVPDERHIPVLVRWAGDD